MTNGQTRYNTALYLRLSKDDGTDSESSSIQTQKEMLTRYCRENGFAISEIYVDDGWSGTNSNRPSFQRMLLASCSSRAMKYRKMWAAHCSG